MRDRVYGVVIGIVRQVDPELGRIKVNFPWLDEDIISHWAPIAAPLSGKERGMFFMPEVDDEVLVAFEHGDINHPFVLGFLWNGVDTPPSSDIDASVRRIKTVSGHILDFDDRTAQEKVKITTQGGHTITLDDTPGGTKIELQTNGGLTIKLDDMTSTISIQAGAKVSVVAPSIELGSGALQPAVLGTNLQTYLTTIINLFNAHMHPGELAAGIIPVTPALPVPPMNPPVGILSVTVSEV
jgi:uncharacterized protein involved in type VI secretion and phage assembly